MKGLDKPRRSVKGRKLKKVNANIPSVFEVFGGHEMNHKTDMPSNMLFLPTQDRIESPIAIDTSNMARLWARGKL